MIWICQWSRAKGLSKCAYLLATTGSSPTSHALGTLNALMYIGFHIIGRAGFKTGALSKRDEISARYGLKIEQIARSVSLTIRQKAYMRPNFYSLMVFRIQQTAWQKHKPGSVDCAYWEGRGWLDSRRTFFSEQRATRLKVAFARLVGAAAAPFIN